MDWVKPDRYLLHICAICLSSSRSMLCNVFKFKLRSRYHDAAATNFELFGKQVLRTTNVSSI